MIVFLLSLVVFSLSTVQPIAVFLKVRSPAVALTAIAKEARVAPDTVTVTAAPAAPARRRAAAVEARAARAAVEAEVRDPKARRAPPAVEATL